MSNASCDVRKSRPMAGKLGRDVDRLAREAGVSRAAVYAFIGGGLVPSGGSDWMDRRVQDEAREYLRTTE